MTVSAYQPKFGRFSDAQQATLNRMTTSDPDTRQRALISAKARLSDTSQNTGSLIRAALEIDQLDLNSLPVPTQKLNDTRAFSADATIKLANKNRSQNRGSMSIIEMLDELTVNIADQAGALAEIADIDARATKPHEGAEARKETLKTETALNIRDYQELERALRTRLEKGTPKHAAYVMKAIAEAHNYKPSDVLIDELGLALNKRTTPLQLLVGLFREP